jgi:hypothetical protein
MTLYRVIIRDTLLSISYKWKQTVLLLFNDFLSING